MTRPERHKAVCMKVQTALIVWAGCLGLSWVWAFDSSGGTTLVTLAAQLSAVGGGALILMFLSRGKTAQDIQPLLRPGIAAISAAVLMLLSVAAVYLGTWGIDWLAGRFLWRPLAWTIVKFVVILIGSLPMGLAVALGLGVLTTRSGDRGRIWMRWLGTAGLAALVLGALVLVGLGVLPIMVLVGIVVVGGGGLMLWRAAPAVDADALHGRAGRVGDGIGVTGEMALVVGILLVQGRLAGDVWGLSLWSRTVLAGMTVCAIAVVTWRLHARPGRIGSRQAIAATVGLVALALVQAAMAMASLRGGGAGVAMSLMAVVCQLPLILLAAAMLSRGRRVFVLRGGGVWAHLCVVACGGAVGVLGYLFAATLPAMHSVLAMVAVGVCTVLTGAWAVSAPRGGRVLQVACSIVLVGACAWLLVVSVGLARQGPGHLTPGFWLTAVRTEDADGQTLEAGYLPIVRTWRSERITEAIVGVMSGPGGRDTMIRGHRGRWWVTRGCRLDFPATLPPRITVIASAADPAAVPPGGRKHRPRTTQPATGPLAGSAELTGLLGDVAAVSPGLWRESLVPGSERSFLQAAHTGAALERYDGAFLAPLPADHVQAWRVYNAETLRRWAARVHLPTRSDPGGVLVLRTGAQDGHLAAALAVARTFHDTVGDSWILIDFKDGVVDLLIVGPRAAVHWPQWRQNVSAVHSEVLVEAWPDIEPITLEKPHGWYTTGEPTLSQLDAWFQGRSRAGR